jgi:hypothetical protein
MDVSPTWLPKNRRQGVMRKILMISLLMFVAGCATTSHPLPVVTAPTQPLPTHEEPIVTPLKPTPQAEPRLLVPAEQPPVTRKSMGLEEFAEANDEKLLNVYVGMSRQTVERLMDGHQSGKWINPYKHQVLVNTDGKQYEILFYLTRAPLPGQRVTESFLTPVIFQNDRVTAIGRYPLKKVRRTACLGQVQGSCP